MSLRHLRLALLALSLGLALAAPASYAATAAATPASATTAATGASLALPPGVTAGPSAEGISEYRFANGFKLLLLPDDSKPTVTVNITYLVGSRHENYGETGMAHLLEHLMFKGSPRYPAIPQEFSKRGMNFNGTTWLDRTNYYETFQAGQDNLQWAIAMEADRMVNSRIARKDLDSEMTVVRNEFEAGETSPSRVMLKRMQSVAYDWHSYGRNTIGARSDIENVRIENLQAFYRTYYQPDNAVLLIAGKFAPAEVLQWVNQTFGRLPRPKRKLPEFWTVEPTQDGERQFAIRRRGDLQLVALGYKMPSALHPDATALSFASDILADTPNGRLHKSLVETGLATAVYSMQLSGFAPGLQMIVAQLKAGVDIEPVKQAMIAAVESFSTTPPTAEEVARLHRESGNNFETLQNNPQQMAVAMSNAIARGDWRLVFIDRDLEQRLGSADIAAAAARYFRRDNRTVGLYLPEDHPQRSEVPAAPSVEALLAQYQPRPAIASGEAFDPAPGNIEQRTTRIAPEQPPHASLNLALLPKKSRGQTVSVSMNLEFGDAQGLFGQRAVAQLTAAMLLRGTEKLDRRQLADEFTRLKINGNVYRFQTTRDNLVPALALAGEVLRHPRMDPAEFTQLKNETLAALEATRKEPDARAAEALQLHFDHYPSGDWRAAQTLEQRIAAVQAVTLEQVKAFHQRFYGASHGELAIVGDFDVQATRAAIDQAFAGWASPAPYARVLHTWADIPAKRIVIDTPDKENGVYLARQNIRLRDDDPDYPALAVANYLLGGSSLKSRLADRIRQQDGLSYGINSGLQVGAISDAGYFSVRAIAAPQNLDKVDAAVREEIIRLIKDGFTDEELLRAKSGILQQRNQQRAGDGGIATSWTALMNLDRSFLWQQQLDLKLADLTLAQLNAAVRKYLDPARMTVVIARDEVKAKAAQP
ncbi:insulinase family protein [Herbaspirillum sp. BH-1]|uniref:Zinc protease n=1 Tax=Herbaspirillum frisingense TaxID=92645 RepID=A0ABU1PCS6_9BURK|nr:MULTISPECIES: pitrilysin family protein [Herbaspirillum]MDR6583560.1 zinc protease [Herbaspirillum frisingense]PLY56954.1 insulinase family protein [Herbaspirillum sp. BH-1]